jgi:SpoVK/Ycf46/Vps4 family AAA+-type ATPase
MASKLRKFLTIASEIIPKLPERKDNLLVRIVKCVGIFDSIDRNIRGFGKRSQLFDFFSEKDLESDRNYQFLDLFFSTGLIDVFEITKMQLEEHMTVVRATHAELGTLYFVECSYSSGTEYLADFWYTKGFNFAGALQILWGKFEGFIHLALTHNDRLYRMQAHYSPIPALEDPLLGDAVQRLGDLVLQHRRYLQDKVPRVYLFSGMQGVGKSSMALRFSSLVGKRTLRVDARGLTTVGTKELDFLIDGLNPDFLIVDDLDRAPELATVLPTLLTIFSDFRGKHPEVTTVLTANNFKALDVALLRPGRIDELIEFDPPTPDERRLILLGYLEELGVRCVDPEPVVAASEGLTAAYLKEVAL